ncbi:hypothetical protein GGC47_005515 [Bosea sp. OAE752]|uniref:hypothetical protein n=1 Tax=Bosea sp. OAE752 TaxID=2663873 RepID=UPI003D1929EC
MTRFCFSGADRFTLSPPVRRLQLQSPLGIGRVLYEMAIEIRRAVSPPNGSPFSELQLGGVDTRANGFQIAFTSLGILDSSPSVHELGDKLTTALVRKR